MVCECSGCSSNNGPCRIPYPVQHTPSAISHPDFVPRALPLFLLFPALFCRKTQVCMWRGCLMTPMLTRWLVCSQSVASSSWMTQDSRASSSTGGIDSVNEVMVMGPTAAATATVAAQRQQRQQRQHGSSGSWMVQDDHAIKCAGMDQQLQQCQHISVQHGSSGSSSTWRSCSERRVRQRPAM